MSRILPWVALVALTISCQSKTDSSVKKSDNTSITPQGYDEALAIRLGADDYGMAKYVMAFLKKGPNRTADKEEAAALQAAHMDNIGRLVDEGKLVLAGPFLDDGELRGIYIFNVDTIDEAKALTETDPAIKAGSLVMELHPWYGSAAVKEIKNLHHKLAKVQM